MTDRLHDVTAAGAARGLEALDVTAIIAAAVAIVAVLASGIITSSILDWLGKKVEQTAWQRTNEVELALIQERLDGFYGPFRAMSRLSQLMLRVLRMRTRDNLVLIRDLFDPDWRAGLPKGEAALLREVIANARKIREFIEARGGVVGASISRHLARAAAHYRMLELAYDGELGSDPEPFKLFVLPTGLETVVGLEVERLKRRRAWLMAHPLEAPPPFEMSGLEALHEPPDWPKATNA